MKQSGNHEKFYQIFLDLLRDVYSAEDQIIHQMPKVIDEVTSKELKLALKQHLAETIIQQERLDAAFVELNEAPALEHCVAMQGLLKETMEVIKKKHPSIVQDAAIIGAIQKIEHYEIASYGTLKAFARHLELKNIEDIVDIILDEEKHADTTLTGIAEGSWITSGINAQAVG